MVARPADTSHSIENLDVHIKHECPQQQGPIQVCCGGYETDKSCNKDETDDDDPDLADGGHVAAKTRRLILYVLRDARPPPAF